MGTSRTFGHQLENVQKEAFPYLLSVNATNLGINAGRSPYPHKCLYSFLHQNGVGDVAFDVIVLEYEHDSDVTIQLARRIRDRFPQAKIIILEMWLLRRWFHMPTGNGIAQWTEANIKVDADRNIPVCDQVRNGIHEARGEDPDKTVWKYLGNLYTKELMEEAASFGAEVFKVPVPVDIYEATNDHACSFFPDMHHYSAMGHRHVAHHIYQLMIDTNMRTHHANVVAKWDSEDQCVSWFQSGIMPLLRHDQENFVMNEFARGKFALEATYGTTSFIKVWNNNPTPQFLSLNRMVTSPDFKYPATKVWIVGDNNQPPAMSALDKPLAYRWQVHLEHELFVGILPPGESTIMMEVLEDKGPEWPFRVVGVEVYTVSQENAPRLS
jgi:hypothetical protein